MQSEDTGAQPLHQHAENVDASLKKVLQHVSHKTRIVKHPSQVQPLKTFGERASDAVASFGGSWAFIGLFFGVLVLWIGVNSIALFHANSFFDPYPYILLNLVLSMLASVQAPLILMSQNRQAAKDRAAALHDYEVNLKAEMDIMVLQDKVAALQAKQETVIALQEESLQLLRDLARRS